MSATDLVPMPPDPSVIEQAADPAQYVVLACERAKAWLADALEHGDIEQIVELRSQAEAIRVYTAQKQLGKDAELSAAEIVRRAERGIGLAIRRGQKAGEMRRPREGGGWPSDLKDTAVTQKKSPNDFFDNTKERSDTYTMTDDVSDDEFEDVIAEAKDEGNLSRANVVRKVKAKPGDDTEYLDPRRRRKVQRQSEVRRLYEDERMACAAIAERLGVSDSTIHDDVRELGIARVDNSAAAVRERENAIRRMAGEAYTSRQIAKSLGISDERVRRIAKRLGVEITADKHVTGTRRIDPTRVIEELCADASLITAGIDVIDLDYSELDASRLEEWVSSLDSAIKSLQDFKRRLNKELTS